MEFDAPKNSPAHKALLTAVGEAGLNTSALRNLFWAINCNPGLVAYAQVFEHLEAHFDSPIFRPHNLAWASAWKNEVADWHELCAWIVKNRRRLTLRQGLEDFNQFREGRHPHINTGVGRHGVAAALWNRHCSTKSYPPSPESGSLAAVRYFELQGHLLASYAEARFRLSTRAFYEAYDAEPERPVAPIQTQSIGLAVREMSLPDYSHAVKLIPSSQSTADFCAQISLFRLSNQERWSAASAEVRDDTDRFLGSIKRYFDRFSEVLVGRKPSQSPKTRGGGGGGKKTHRHGFINTGPAWVLMEEDHPPTTDPELVEPPGQAIWIDAELAKDAKASRTQKTRKTPSEPAANASVTKIEESGLSPAETLEETFRLYAPADFKGQIRAMYYQRLAAESRAQALAFDFSQLTPTEIQIVAKRCLNWTAETLSGPQSASEEAQTQEARLIAGVMLTLGQQVQRACALRVAWRLPSTPPEDLKPLRNMPTLIVRARSEGDWDHAVVEGFCLPGLTPQYKTDLAEKLEEIDSDSADCFVLPDLFGLGQQILRYMRLKLTKDSLVFDLDETSALKAVTALCKSCPSPRITPEKIAQVLPSLVTSLTGDQSLAWILTADVRRRNQTRMFYTRHSEDRLQKEYLRAARHLCKTTGMPLLTTPDRFSPSPFSPGVGTRFVMSISEVRELVASLQNLLSETVPGDRDRSFFVWYHNAFAVYTHLFQSLDTSLRAISEPDDLFKIMRTSVRLYGVAYATLSDKDTAYSSKARLVCIRRPMEEQFTNYAKHINCLDTHITSLSSEIELSRDRHPFFIVNENLEFKSLSPSFVEGALKHYTGYDVPANFHRAFLRTELLRRGCAAEVVDAFLGHSNFGESSFSRHSSFDFRLHLDRIDRALQEIHDDIGLKPIESRIAFKRLPRSRS